MIDMEDDELNDAFEAVKHDLGHYYGAMVVDSNRDHRESLVQLLQLHFYVQEEESAEKVQGIVMNGGPWFVDVIFTEIVGLDMDGVEFLQSISEGRTPIIVLSECKDSGMRSRAESIPWVMEYKEKPAALEWIEHILNNMEEYKKAGFEGRKPGNDASDLAGSNPVPPADKEDKVEIWTPDLRKNFAAAVKHLERESEKPTAQKVLELMVEADSKVSLTRVQVQSRLQVVKRKHQRKLKKLAKEDTDLHKNFLAAVHHLERESTKPTAKKVWELMVEAGSEVSLTRAQVENLLLKYKRKLKKLAEEGSSGGSESESTEEQSESAEGE